MSRNTILDPNILSTEVKSISSECVGDNDLGHEYRAAIEVHWLEGRASSPEQWVMQVDLETWRGLIQHLADISRIVEHLDVLIKAGKRNNNALALKDDSEGVQLSGRAYLTLSRK
jgi:hypothetical protein